VHDLSSAGFSSVFAGSVGAGEGAVSFGCSGVGVGVGAGAGFGVGEVGLHAVGSHGAHTADLTKEVLDKTISKMAIEMNTELRITLLFMTSERYCRLKICLVVITNHFFINIE
jgi:L-aminopeptidase/D-esterase-like protein